MNQFGNYTPEFEKGIPQIEPITFFDVNWPIACEWAGVNPPPTVCISADTDGKFVRLPRGVFAFQVHSLHGPCIFLDAERLQENFFASIMDPNASAMGYLWALLVSVARFVAKQMGILKLEDCLTIEHLRPTFKRFSAEHQERLMEWFQHTAGNAPEDHSCAQYLAQAALTSCILDPLPEHVLLAIASARASTFSFVVAPPNPPPAP